MVVLLVFAELRDDLAASFRIPHEATPQGSRRVLFNAFLKTETERRSLRICLGDRAPLHANGSKEKNP